MLLLSKLKAVLGAVLAVAVLAGGLGVRTLSLSWAGPQDANTPKPAAAAPAGQPGPHLDDKEFLRRVSLDLRGLPPTEVEMRYFVTDTNAKKRALVVEWILRDVGDVKNVAGSNDSIWIDLGLPALAAPDGRRYRAIMAPLVLDLDTRLETPTAVRWVVDPGQVSYDRYANTVLSTPTVTYSYPDLNAAFNANVVNEVFVDSDDARYRITIDPAWQAYQGWFRKYASPNLAANYEQVRLWDVADTSDEDFLRRACQDARGAAPTTVEAEYFKADKDPKKREKLLDLLLKDPAVAKKLGAAWKKTMLQPAHDDAVWLTTRRAVYRVRTLDGHVLWAKKTPDRLDQTLDQLLDTQRTDAQVLEGLSLAVLGRLPTESERHLVLANVSKQQDKKAAWRDVLKTLAGTSEAKQHAEEVKRRGEKK